MDNTTTTATTKSPLSDSITALTDAIAAEVVKNLESTIQRRLERLVEDYLEGDDFAYTLDDIVKDKLTEIVDEHVSNISVRIEVEQ